MGELAKCPFCHSFPRTISRDGRVSIGCKDPRCDGYVTKWYDSFDEAVRDWNAKRIVNNGK